VRVEAIFTDSGTSETANAVRHDSREVLAGLGLEGDRYAAHAGHWQKVHGIESKVRDVSFVTLSGLERAAERNGWTDDPIELARLSRRNIAIDEGDLGELIGKHFSIGDALFLGTGECNPCSRPGKYSGGRLNGFGREGLGLESSAGLRARVLKGGLIAVSQEVIVEEDEIIGDKKDKEE
jgi:MOSC domain-containing protein YiiM